MTPGPVAWVRLLSAHARLTRPMNVALLAEHDLTLNDYEVLLHLSWAPAGRMTRTALARSVHLTQSGITRLLYGLARAGLVTSSTSATDRRAVEARLTDKGRERLRAAAISHTRDVAALFTDHFSAEELAVLAELLGRLQEPAVADAPDPPDGAC